MWSTRRSPRSFLPPAARVCRLRGRRNGVDRRVDAASNERLPEEYKLGAHPESFQLESSGTNIYVNLPDLKQIAVINRKTHAIIRWPMTLEHNFPMALDEADHCLFVATHEPPRLAVFDTDTGKTIAILPCVQDADDTYYDAGRKRIYVPGGEGCISESRNAPVPVAPCKTRTHDPAVRDGFDC